MPLTVPTTMIEDLRVTWRTLHIMNNNRMSAKDYRKTQDVARLVAEMLVLQEQEEREA